MPLQLVLDHFVRDGYVIDWIAFVEDALAIGWGLSTALSRIEEASTDVLGREDARAVMNRLRAYVATRGSPRTG